MTEYSWIGLSQELFESDKNNNNIAISNLFLRQLFVFVARILVPA